MLGSQGNVGTCQCTSAQYYSASANSCVNKLALFTQCSSGDTCIDNATCIFPNGGSAYSCQCISSNYDLNGACGMLNIFKMKLFLKNEAL
jgi:hypothetical protein